ncbi:MAG: type IV pilin protein [Candidatus Methylomirabilota bacterium]
MRPASITRGPIPAVCPPVADRWRGTQPILGRRPVGWVPAPCRGFTLIELLIVITIIGILITLAQPSYNRAVTAAKEATLKENLFILRDAIDQYYADNAKYPMALSDLAEKKYIRRVPKDPVTGSVETWVLVYFTDEQGQQQGIFDVKSGSEAVALDGTSYHEW